MEDDPPRFNLHCDPLRSEFRLSQEGESWQRDFASMEEALRYAGTIVTTETRVLIRNYLGKVVVESWLSPVRFDAAVPGKDGWV